MLTKLAKCTLNIALITVIWVKTVAQKKALNSARSLLIIFVQNQADITIILVLQAFLDTGLPRGNRNERDS